MIRDVARLIAEMLDASEEDDISELYNYIRGRVCDAIKRNIEELRQKRHWPILKPLLKRALHEILEECGVRL